MSNEGQEWESWFGWLERWLNETSGENGRAFVAQVAADHRDAQQLRERVRVLEEALSRYGTHAIGCSVGPYGEGECDCGFAALLSSPSVATGEGP